MALLSYIVECLDARITGYYKGSRSYGLCAIHGQRGVPGGRNVVSDEKGNEIPISDYNNPSFWHRHLGTSITTDQASGRGSELEQTASVNMVLVAYAKRELVGSASALGESLSALLQTIPDNWFNALGYRTLQVRPNSVSVEPLAVLSAQFAGLQVDTSPDSVLVSVTYTVEAKYLPSCIINTLCASGAVDCLEISCLPEPAVGPRGPRGYSDFEVAQIEGFTGTVTEWLASLNGANGANGAKGDKGDKGDTGEQGPPGDPATNLVKSVFGRDDEVVAQSGDYSASLISYTPTAPLTATDVQAAIEQAVAQILSSFYPRIPVGRDLSGTLTCGGNSVNIYSADDLQFYPYVTNGPISIDRIQARATGGGSAGSEFRLGFYLDNGNNYPGDLIIETGALDGTTTTTRSVDITEVDLPGPFVWLALLVNNTATRPSFRAWSTNILLNILGTINNDPINNISGWRMPFTYGSLPLTAPAGLVTTANVPMPCVGARRSA